MTSVGSVELHGINVNVQSIMVVKLIKANLLN